MGSACGLGTGSKHGLIVQIKRGQVTSGWPEYLLSEFLVSSKI